MKSEPYSPSRGDIVDQLLNWEGDYHYPSGLLDAAADEIFRLRMLVRQLDDTIDEMTEDLQYGLKT